ncbi:MAG: CDP-alcohol phosphatidyltransferase family protein [candidate division Zixibacteria bacterium]|nr:CDP-alcohol phosphatidyltransferase family protein [candidate division Zixibacteria bacterium]
MSWRQILWPSNLLSLLRIVLALPMGYCLSLHTPEGTVSAVAILAVAGITDFLDGYVARRSGRISALGAALDPIADKLFAAVLVMFLIAYREFPIWLAVALVGRDLVLLIGGMVLLKRDRPTIPARLYGKYLFFASIFLLGSYVIEYEFGATLSTVAVLGLCALSLADYARVFTRVVKGNPLPPHDPKLRWKTVRVLVTAVLVLIYAIEWLIELPR